jgi:hypothetical protein
MWSVDIIDERVFINELQCTTNLPEYKIFDLAEISGGVT